MLTNAKANTLVDSFAWQWLGMESLESHAVLSDSFPDWDEPLREAMLGEARQYLTEFVLGEANWKDFLSADIHFVNSRLAVHYGAPDGFANEASEFKQYAGDTPSRLGFMGTAGFLTVSSFAHRTSPTLRAKWILESLLCSPPPPPPPELAIPDLDADEAANQAASIDNVRERLALHRTDPNCASCHSYLDPLGLALENFDAVGRYREDYSDGTEVDPTGELPDGTPLAGLPDLVAFIGKDDRFMRCTAEKLFTYAMGRAPNETDTTHLTDVAARWQTGTASFPQLVQQLTASVPFTQRQKASQE
jgi:mono/diheme cytochrome c family protein